MFVSVASKVRLYMPLMRCVPPPLFLSTDAAPFFISFTSVLLIVRAVSRVLKSVSSTNGPTIRDWLAVDCFKKPFSI